MTPKLSILLQVETPQPSDSDESDDEPAPAPKAKFSDQQVESAVDITEKFIFERMNPAIASEIDLRSMKFLPREIPPQFFNTYTPIAAAGTEGQVKHVSRLLATQLTAAGIGPGVEEQERRRKAEASARAVADEEEEDAKRIATIGNIRTIPLKYSCYTTYIWQ